jgi:gamma-glutamylputrescine oxidase
MTRTAAYAGMPGYYAATANPAPDRPPLAGEARADVCIVGGGFTGLSAALELAGHGLSVILLEAERVGWGASGRNGGQLINGYSRGLDVIGKRYGPDAERGLGEMALEGGRLIRERVAAHDIQCDLVDGGFVAAFNRKQLEDLREEVAVWAHHGHTAPFVVERDGLADIVRTDRYIGGMVDPLSGHFHPLNFLLGEAAAFEQLGGTIHEHSRVIAVEEGARPRVRTGHGTVSAEVVLLCGNAYLEGVAPALESRVMPVSSQIIVTEPLGDRAEALLPGNHCVEDSNYILDYYRRTADGRLLYGGGVVYGGRDPASIEGKIRPNMLKTFPDLADVRIDHAWSGIFALTLSRIPQIGRLSPNIYFSHGDSGHGVTTTQLLGRLLGEAVRGQMARFDLFAGLPYSPFPGGRAFRVPLSVLGSWYYSIRDRLGI